MSEEVFIVLFRGVGGKTQLPTKPLREALTAAGFRSVATYIASGNVVLASDHTAEEVRYRVAALAEEKFSFTKEIMVVARREWAELIAENPFPQVVDKPTTLHVFVLTEVPSAAAIAALAAKTARTERVEVKGRRLYFHAPEGFGPSKLPPLLDRILGVVSTARNWNTVVNLGKLADEAASQRGASSGTGTPRAGSRSLAGKTETRS